MNTAQIAYALEQDPKMNNMFCGAFPSDKLPQTIDKYPCGLVANTNPSTRPGAHWVSILMTSGQNAEWFDSYGKPGAKRRFWRVVNGITPLSVFK